MSEQEANNDGVEAIQVVSDKKSGASSLMPLSTTSATSAAKTLTKAAASSATLTKAATGAAATGAVTLTKAATNAATDAATINYKLREMQDGAVPRMMHFADKGGGDGSLLIENAAEQKASLEELEARVRQGVPNEFVTSILSIWASFKVLFIYLVTIETYIALAGSIGMTCYWYFTHKDNTTWDGGGLSWVLVGFAVVLPMSNLVKMGFGRREEALKILASLRSCQTMLYHAHALWDWDKGNGRANADLDILAHCDELLDTMYVGGEALVRFLTLPTSTLTRHQVTYHGQQEAHRTLDVAVQLYDVFASRQMVKYTKLAERIKRAGLSGTLRSFARVFTICLPAFYASTFAQLAIEIQSLGMGIAMAVITTLCLTSLYESILVMEDPFVAFLVLDGISIHEELMLHNQQVLTAREEIFPDAAPYKIPNSSSSSSAAAETDNSFADEQPGKMKGEQSGIPQRRQSAGMRGSLLFKTNGS
ncbi:protein Hydra magnipapillata [Seminavis robusta]|uniref:Protein Hydra magnipapillata n=1 Tax=Seminavis robusta TaxID=568900 RepID=A0A9N8ESV8_9STRA|nr:protein Hydra magnipapillata [Seminavis robusta]|eukprot:Sro1862_g302230.1 protein Hydra magnipapillata (479) ;mRNA; f:3903-5429